MRSKKDIIAIILLFLTGFISLDILDGVLWDIFGICFYVAAVYGIICINKGARFLF